MLKFKTIKSFNKWLEKNNYGFKSARVENQAIEEDMRGNITQSTLFVSIEVEFYECEQMNTKKYFVLFESKTVNQSLKIWDILDEYSEE